MSLISKSGAIANEWNVPYARRHAALEHAMDRAEQEGHAGVLWGVIDNGMIRGFSFDSHDPEAILCFASLIQPYLTKNGLDMDRLVGEEMAQALIQRSRHRV
jgi:hypothetical protein